MDHIVEIANDFWKVGITPAGGGSIAYAKVLVQGAWVDVMRVTPQDKLADAWSTASFPLIPWSNRIPGGAFPWNGQDRTVRVNFADGTAIHGTALEYGWEVDSADETSVTLSFDSRKHEGVNWPWDFTSRQVYSLDGERFACTMELSNPGNESFPGGLGHHPYFVRDLGVGAPAHLQLNCETYYPAVGCIPTAGPSPLEPRVDFRSLRPLGTEFVDDCWTGRSSSTLATIEYPGALTVDLEAGALYEHAVVYIPLGEDNFCVEPVTNANNGVNLLAEGAAGTGVFAVEPGETRASTFTLIAQPHA